MSIFRIHRTDKLDNPVSYFQEPISQDLSAAITPIFESFAQEQRLLQHNLDYTLAPICSNARNQELLSFMRKRFSLNLSQDQVLLVFQIASYVKKLPLFTLGKPNRFKIEGLCSFSLLSHTKEAPLEDTIIIHQKKKSTVVVLGKGISSKVCKALMFSQGSFSWIADKTTYSPTLSDNSWVSLGVDPHLFLGVPKFKYSYYQEKNEDDTFGIKKKHCSIETLYDLSLIEMIEAHQNQPFLSEDAMWKIALSLISMLQNLHQRDLVYRDLKPDNILVALDKPFNLFDMNQFKLVAADLETVAKHPEVGTRWVGSRPYFPQDTINEKQDKPSDIYALGIILGNLFSKSLEDKFYIFEVISLIARMKEENPLLRPPIEEVAHNMNSLQPSYLHRQESEINCFGISDCVIS